MFCNRPILIMKRTILCLASAALFAAASMHAESAGTPEPTSSGTPSLALSLEGGTTGLGGSIWITASDQVTITLGYGALDVSNTYTTDESDYDGTVKLSNGHAILNWHPLKGHFIVSGGVIVADDKYDAIGVPAAGTVYTFNGVDYPSVQVGNLRAHADVAKGTSGYVGVGWASRPRQRGFGFFVNLGAMFSGSAKVTLSADGPIASDPTFQANLDQERRDIQRKLDRYKVYPVVRAGVLYRF